VLTGMTRDGAFLIENGEVVAPLVDLRFTQNAVDALKSLLGAANDTRLCQPGFAQVLTPTLAIGRFRITGTKGG
jgi:PmbA protein